MFINSLLLNNYKYFKLSDIMSFDWHTIGKVSNIQGKNGSGKSSLLREALPTPSVRTSFLKNGKCAMTLTHDDINYEITSDFSLKDGAHSFIKGTEELNISGKTGIQQELIETHLGLTPTTCKLLTIGYQFTQMTPSVRKGLLSTLNPMNMALVLEKHKEVASKLRACKNNLSLLYKRKDEIENQMLKPEVLAEILRNKQILEDQKSLLTLWQYTLTTHLEKIKKIDVKNGDVDLDIIQRDITQINLHSVNYHAIDRQDYEQYRVNLSSKISGLSAKIHELQKSIVETVNELEKYEKYLQDTPSDEIVSLLEEKIKEVEAYIADFFIPEGYDPLTETEITEISGRLNEISDLLSTFITDNTLGVEITKTTDQMAHELEQLRDSYTYHDSQVQSIERELNGIEQRISTNTIPIPDNCPTDTCQLYKHHFETIDADTARKEKLVDKLISAKREKEKIQSTAMKLKAVYEVAKSFDDRYHRFIRITTQELSGLSSMIRDIDVSMFNNQPMHILNLIKERIDISRNFHRRKKAQDELQDLQKKILETSNENKPSLDLLKDLINTNRKALDSKRSIHSQLSTELAVYRGQADTLNRYINDVETIKEYQEYLKKHLYKQELDQSIIYYEKLLVAICEIINRIDEELYELKETSKGQEQLQDRLNEEILHLIKEIEHEFKRYSILEAALSPSIGLPHKYMTGFLNSIIKNANIFISKVFTYPFYIHKLDIGQPLNYKFKVKVGDETVPDISECSAGQKDMINLAMNLALILQLKLNHYPVFIDEADKTLDEIHKQELLNLFAYLIENGIIQQLFIVNHHAAMTGINGDNVVLGDTNTLNVENFNEFIKITKY